MTQEETSASPDNPGSPRHFLREGHAHILAILVLVVLLGLAFTGLFGGGANSTRTAHWTAAELQIESPRSLRSSDEFHTRISVLAHRPIHNLVIGFSEAWWRNVTTKSAVPMPVDESFANGFYRYGFGKLEPGQAFELDLDSQMNAPMTLKRSGAIALFDGDRLLGKEPMNVRVWP